MDDIYRELQQRIAELKTESTGLADFSNIGASMDSYFSDRLTLDGGSRVAYIQGPEDVLDSMRDQTLDYLACLRALYMVHQHAHWTAAGDSYYGDHLLFQRLYENIAGETDAMAEKIAGYLGADVILAPDLVSRTQTWVDKWSQTEDPIVRSLEAERDFQAIAKDCYEQCKAAEVMTLGFDDFIMATASAHEAHEYLLQQRLESLGSKRQARTKKARTSRHSIRVSSLGDLSNFLKLSKDVLIHKSDKDLWRLKKDADGNHVIEKLYDSDVLTP